MCKKHRKGKTIVYTFSPYLKYLILFFGYLFTAAAFALDVKVTLDRDTKAPGGYLYYRILVSNTEGTTRDNVTVSIDIPAEVTLIESNALPALSNCLGSTCDPGETALWDLGDVASGQSKIILAPFIIDSDAADSTAIDLQVDTSYDGLTNPITASVGATVVDSPAAAISISSEHQVVAPGDPIHYSVSFGNIGSLGLANTQIRATIPAGTTLISASDGGVEDSGEVVWDVGVVNAGNGGKRYFSVQTAAAAPNGTIYSSDTELNDGGSVLVSGSDSIVVRTGVNLSLDVTAMTDHSQPDDHVYYRYVVANHGSTNLTDVTLNLLMGEGFYFVESSSLPTIDDCLGSTCDRGEWGSYTIASLLAGETRVIELPVTRLSPVAGEPLVSHAILTEGSGAYALGTKPTVIARDESFLQLAVSAKKQVVAAGERHRYEISFGNVSATAYQNLQLQLALPDGATFIEASDGGSSENSLVSWSLGTLNAGVGGKRYVTIDAPAAAVDGNVLVSRAWLNTGGPRLLQSSESVVVRDGVELTLDVAVSNDQSQPDNLTYYRYVIANQGTTDLTDISLNLMMSERSYFVESSSLPTINNCLGSTCDNTEWGSYSLATLPAGETRVLTLPVTRLSPRDGEPLVSRALLTEGSGAYTLGTKPTVIANDETFLELSVSAEKQVVAAGERHQYELSFGNLNTTAYQNMRLQMVLSDATTFVEASDGGTVEDGIVSWSLNTLNSGVGGKRYVTLDTSATAQNGDLLFTQASLDTGGEKLIQSSESVVVRDDVKLAMEVSLSSDQSQPNDLTFYRYAIANQGDTDLTDVTLNLMMSERSYFAESSSLPTVDNCLGSTCDNTEWGSFDITTLPAGETRILTIPMTRLSPFDGEPLVTHAILTEGSGAYTLGTKPSVIANDEIFLDLSISAEKQVVASGENHRYQLSFGNLSATAYQNLQLQVKLPSGTTFLEASDGGTFENGLVNWALGTVNAGVGGKRFFTLSVADDATDGQILVANALLSIGGETLIQSSESVVIRDGVQLDLKVATIGDHSQPGNLIYQQYIVSNTGLTDLTDVSLNLMMAERSYFIESSSLPSITDCLGSTCDNTEWGSHQVDTLAAGDTFTLTIPITRLSPLDGEPLVSHAVLTEGSEAYSLGSKPTVINNNEVQTRLVIESEENVIKPGSQQTFDLVVGNPTNTAIANALLVVEIPEHFSFVSASGTNENIGSKVYWPLGNVAANQWTEKSLTLLLESDVDDAKTLLISAYLEDDSNQVSIARASNIMVIDSADGLELRLNTALPIPITDSSEITVNLSVENESATAIADVNLNVMTPEATFASEADSGLTNCLGSTCDNGEWGTYELGEIDSAATEQRTFVVTTLTPAAGEILVFNTHLYDSSTPHDDIVLTQAWGVGTAFNVDPNHDSDSDGIPDWWEIRWGYDRLDADDATTDGDGDGADNLEEYQEATDPTDQDTDNDGILDGPDNDPLNDNPPIANAGEDATFKEASIVTLDGRASQDSDDPNQTVSLNYSWLQTGGNAVALRNATSATPTFTAPNVNAAENFTFELTVEDPTGNTAKDSVTITVSPDSPPVANAGPDQPSGNDKILAGDLVSLSGANSSDDFDAVEALQFLWQEVDSTLISLSDQHVINPTFIAPSFGTDGGSLRLRLTVTDSASQSSADEVVINVSPLEAPIADAGVEQNVGTRQTVQLDATNSSDSDGEIVSYQWSQISGETVTLSEATIARPTFTTPENEGALTFQVTVTDNHNLSADDQVTINVTSHPVPVCDAGPIQNVEEFTNSELTTVTLDGSNSAISSGTIASYLWRQNAGENVTLTDPNEISTDFVVNSVDVNGASYTFELICESDQGVQSRSETIVNVTNLNLAPVAIAGDNQQVNEGDTVTLDGTASSDPDGDSITFLWSLKSSSNGSGVTLDSPTLATTNFVAPDVDDAIGETFTFTLTVTDGDLSHSADVVVNVLGEDTPPTADAGSDQVVDEGRSVTLNGSGSSDVQGIVGYQWRQLSGPQVALTNGNQEIASFTAPSVENGNLSLSFELTVTDSGQNTDTDTVVVTVNAVDEDDGGGGGGSGSGSYLFISLLALLCIRRKDSNKKSW